MAEPASKRMKEENEERSDPFVSPYIGEKQRIPRLPPIDDGVVEIVDPTIREPTAPPPRFIFVDGVRIQLVEPKEEEVDVRMQLAEPKIEEVDSTDEMEAMETGDEVERGRDTDDSMDSNSNRTPNQTLKDLLSISMAETTDKMGKTKRMNAGSERRAKVYEVLDDDDEVDGQKEGQDGTAQEKPKYTDNRALFTPKFIPYWIKCHLCNLKSDHPLAHFWYHFEDQPRYKCPQCSATSGRVEDAVIHMRTEHNLFDDGPIDRKNGLRMALWDYQIHQCFPDNFKLEPESTMPARLHEMVDCRCGYIADKEDPILFNHIVRFHADEDIDYDDPEGMKNRYYFDDPDGTRLKRKMEIIARSMQQEVKKEKPKGRVRHQLSKADSDSEESDEDEEEEESEDEDEDEEELEEDEVEVEEDEVEGEEDDDDDGLE